MRRIFLILGAVLGIIVAAGIFLFLQFSRPPVTDVPVAIGDIPAGTILRPYFFRVVHMSNVDRTTLDKWITFNDWNQAEGKVATSDIHMGFPIARAQIDPNSSTIGESRLSALLTGTNDYYLVIPATPNETGNFLQPGDRIDLIVSIGSADRFVAMTLPLTRTNTTRNVSEASQELTQTAALPISKLVVQNMSVLRVDRDRVKSNSSDSGSPQSLDPQFATADVKRIYVKVDRDQLEVLSFVLNNGKHNFAVRAATGSADSVPTDGVTWDDFARWFFSQRGNKADGAQPFDNMNPAGPDTTTP